MNILLIGVNYAPEHSGNAPYTTGMAEDLSQRGHDVTVLTGMPHYPSWRVPETYRRRLSVRQQHNSVGLIRRALYVPVRQSALRRAMYEGSFLLTGLLPLRIATPDVVIGVVPTLSGGLLARLIGRRYKAPYGLLFQDLMGLAAAQSGIGGGGRVARVTKRAERWVARGATAVAAVSPSFFPYLRDLGVGDDQLFHIPNWTHVETPQLSEQVRRDLRHDLGWADDETIALHAGNMGHKQHLAQVLAAAKLADGRDANVRLVLLGDGNQRAALQQQAAAERIKRVQFLPPQPDDRFMSVLAAADVLLVTERASVRDMALPSKLTSYAVAGRPVVAAVNAGGATSTELQASGMALIASPEDPAALLGAIQRLASDPTLADRLAASGVAYAGHSLGAQQTLDRAHTFVELVAADRQGQHVAARAA